MFGFDIFAIVFVALVILTLFAGVKTVSNLFQPWRVLFTPTVQTSTG